MKRNIQGVTILMALVLAGCGSQADGDNAAASAAGGAAAVAATDPCSLVTTDEVGAIIGEAVTGTEKGEGSCTYQTADAQASSVTIELNQSDAARQMATARQAAGILKDMGGAVADQGSAGADVNAALSDSGDTPKVGDEAFFGPNQQLSVRKGSSYIAVSPPMMRSRMGAGNPMLSSDDKKKMAVAIAEKAVGRLP
jgi:hypothetical protein